MRLVGWKCFFLETFEGMEKGGDEEMLGRLYCTIGYYEDSIDAI